MSSVPLRTLHPTCLTLQCSGSEHDLITETLSPVAAENTCTVLHTADSVDTKCDYNTHLDNYTW